MEPKHYDVAILGAGPGGYVAAIRAAQRRLSVCLIEADALGGICLNTGCIPTKSLVKSAAVLDAVMNAEKFGVDVGNVSFNYSTAQKRKEMVVDQLKKGLTSILKRRGIDIVNSYGVLTSPHTISVRDQQISFTNCIIATGAYPIDLEYLRFDTKLGVLSSDEILKLPNIPSSLAIIGGGVIGCEFSHIFSRFGSEVTIIEMDSQLLPAEDKDIVQPLVLDFKKRGVNVLTNAKVQSINSSALDMPRVYLEGGNVVEAEKVLLAIGRKANIEGYGLSEIGVKVENGQIVVDEKMCTNIDNIYAIGDVVGKFWLAHVASSEAKVAIDNIAGFSAIMKYDAISRCIYTHPEIASVGITEAQAKIKGLKVKIGKFPFMASGRALIESESQGMCKIIADEESGKVIGAAICGCMATELIAELVMAIDAGYKMKDITKVIHAHPTLSETVLEAVEALEGNAIHIL